MSKLSLSKARIGEVMTKDLVVVSLDCTVDDAVEKMVDYAVECLPVVDAEGALHGLITFRDVVMKVVYPKTTEREMKVEEIMSKKLVTCDPNSSVLDIVKIMKNRHLRRIPVVVDENRLVGLVTDFDLALFGWDIQ
jgi:CBS domain-containing protein